jgi:hypothetical protein
LRGGLAAVAAMRCVLDSMTSAQDLRGWDAGRRGPGMVRSACARRPLAIVALMFVVLRA